MNSGFSESVEKGTDSHISYELTAEDVEKIIAEVTERFSPYRAQIEALRQANPEREVGGRISKDGLVLFDESRWEKNAVLGESPLREREIAESGLLSFHTHPDSGLTNESGMDIMATYFRFCEIIVHRDGVSCLVALKRLPVEEIQAIDRKAWAQAQIDEEECGDPAYWFWKGALEKELPTQSVKIF